MSLTRRLILSFAVILLLSLVNILAHVWGSQERSALFSQLQSVMYAQTGVRELEQQFDNMHKKVRVIRTLVEAGDSMPISAAEAREQIASLDRLDRLLAGRTDHLALTLPDAVDASALTSLLHSWRQYLGRFLEKPVAVEAPRASPASYEDALRTLWGFEAALVDRASAINLSLNEAVTTTNRIVMIVFAVSLLVTVVLALHLVTFTLRSIRALHRGTEHWGRGDLDYQVPPLDGELGRLAESFNHMARNLRIAMNEVKSASARADAANQAKSSFLANMSHELRTPMNAIIGYSEMLLEEAADDSDQKFTEFAPDLEKILSAGQHLLALINDVLDISKIESGKMTVYRESADIAQLMEEVLATVQPLVDRNNNELKYRNTLSELRAEIDVTRFRQIALNLLSNAAKFTQDGEIDVCVRDVEAEGKSFIEIAVADNGIGMTPEQTERVFDAFIQADLSTTREYGGTGLGLTISRKFAELLGGDISVESELGKGSRFCMRIPRLRTSTASENGVAEKHHGRSGETVLVVDDQDEARELCRRHLEYAGFSVIESGTGGEAVRRARSEQPDLIVLDVMMPTMDGWQVLEELRQSRETAHIPVIIQSMVNEREMGNLMRVDDYLVKPVEREVLVAAVRQTLARQGESVPT